MSTSGGTILPAGATPDSEDFRVYTKAPLVKFLSRGVQPPSQVYVDTSDVLTVGCASSVAGEQVTISYRLLTAGGQLMKGQFTINPAADRSVAVKNEPMAEGFLLSVSCKAKVATTRGQTFVRVFLSDPALGAGFPSYMLMADYVTTAMAPAHPNGRQLAPVEGPGNPRGLRVFSPGGGLQIGFAVPTNARWRVNSAFAQLTTDAVVGNRHVGIQVISAGANVFVGWCPDVQPASTLRTYGASTFTATPLTDPATGMLPLPAGVVLLAGNSLNTITFGMDAADSWAEMDISVEEWLDNV